MDVDDLRPNDRVRVWWSDTTAEASGPQEGRVVDTRHEMDRRGQGTKLRFQVEYFAGELAGKRRWHAVGEWECVGVERLRSEEDSSPEATLGWGSLELRCVLTHQRLTDPAKGARCRHKAVCNFDALVRHVGGAKACPVCMEPLQRSRDVERDEALCTRLSQLPAFTQVVWMRGDDELRTALPDEVDTSKEAKAARRSGRRSGTVVID